MKEKKPKLGTILDEGGNPVTRPADSIEDLNLPPGVQALIETRIDSAIGQIRELNRDDLQRLADETSKKWRYLFVLSSIVAVLSIGWNVFSWFVAPEKVQAWIGEYVQQKVAEPALKEALTNAAQREAEAYVNAKIQPLEDRTLALKKEVGIYQNELAVKQGALSQEQSRIIERLAVQELSISAKLGANESYEKLLRLAAGSGENADAAKLQLKDVVQFYEADRNQITYQTLVDSVSQQDPGYGADELFQWLEVEDEKLREGVVNTIATIEAKSMVGYLCLALKTERNLRVKARLTRAIEKLSGAKLGPLEFDKVDAWWAANKAKPEFNFLQDDFVAGVQIFQSSSGAPELFNVTTEPQSAEAVIERLKRVVEREPKAHVARFHLVAALCSLNRLEEAQTQVSLWNSESRWKLSAEGILALAQGKRERAIERLSAAFVKSPTHREIMQRLAVFAPLRDDPNLWKNK